MNRHFLTACLLILAVALCNCSEKIVSPPDADEPGLSDRQIEILNSVPSVDASLDEIILPNGISVKKFMDEFDPTFLERYKKHLESTGGNPEGFYKAHTQSVGPQDAKNLAIGKMTEIAQDLADRSKYQKPIEGDHKPEQNGLAYVYGGKNHLIRQRGNRNCDDSLYGLDCSGLFYHMVGAAGFTLPNGPAEEQRSLPRWEKILKSDARFEKLGIKDLGGIPPAEIETGDMIYWTNNAGVATHIGAVLEKPDGKLGIYQSYGGKNQICKEVNDGKNCGPRRYCFAL